MRNPRYLIPALALVLVLGWPCSAAWNLDRSNCVLMCDNTYQDKDSADYKKCVQDCKSQHSGPGPMI